MLPRKMSAASQRNDSSCCKVMGWVMPKIPVGTDCNLVWVLVGLVSRGEGVVRATPACIGFLQYPALQ